MDSHGGKSLVLERKDFRGSLIPIAGFVAVLSWWIGLSGYLNVGGVRSGGEGFFVFLLIPLLVSAAVFTFVARFTRSRKGPGRGRHKRE
jgi:hypothetical protein